MELQPIQDALLQVYPQWDAFFRETEFIDSLEVDPTANDGQRIYYNSRRFQFYTAEHRAVLLGREVLHVLLQHNARRQGCCSTTPDGRDGTQSSGHGRPRP